ncbi:MAG: hypothetical protein IKL53_01555 [Lachnospiraceae bacterium]|nr:hypothetical protein [Lachnospiraceae bacterium]
MLTHEEYRDYTKRFKQVERYLKSKSADSRTVAYNICKFREYYPERMMPILEKAGFMFIEGDDSVYDALEGVGDDLGLFSNEGRFLLSGRFIFPVKDMLGNTIALIGWFPDKKKYITTPSRLFSKNCLFFGMEQLAVTGTGKEYFLCEGIFDTLSLRSIGLNAISEMGIDSGRVKESLYPLFSRLIGTPDNDTEGRSVIDGDKWRIPSNGSYMKWISDDYYKDIDKVINSFEREDIRNEILQKTRSNNRLIKLHL